MKKIFSSIYFKILIVVLPVVTILLISFYSYNEYTYNKIGISIAEGNYSLAQNYADSISPSYKDIRKIKNLLLTVSTHNSNNPDDIRRTFERLESFKGFENENINYFYNKLLFSIYKEMTAYTANYSPNFFTQTQTSEFITTSAINTENYPSIETSIYTTDPSVIFSSTQTSVFSTENYSVQQPIYQGTNEITTQQTTKTTTTNAYSTNTVYYVESGEVYHISADCRTLSRSTNILSGPIPAGRRACKVCG